MWRHGSSSTASNAPRPTSRYCCAACPRALPLYVIAPSRARARYHGRAAMLFRQLFDSDTSPYTYLVADDATGDAMLIDPVLPQIERDVGLIEDLGLSLRYALDTHVHADHV